MTNRKPTNDHPAITPDVDECPVCRQLRLDGPDEHVYAVAPGDGGGWPAWSAALLRLFVRIGDQPTQAVIIEQPALTGRYVQVLIGHGLAHVEASSNVYLEGECRLSAEHEDLLTVIGWLAPEADHDDPDEMPANWHLPLIRRNWRHLVEILVATIAGVFAFNERAPIEIRTFGAENPCQGCSWPDESTEPPK